MNPDSPKSGVKLNPIKVKLYWVKKVRVYRQIEREIGLVGKGAATDSHTKLGASKKDSTGVQVPLPPTNSSTTYRPIFIFWDERDKVI